MPLLGEAELQALLRTAEAARARSRTGPAPCAPTHVDDRRSRSAGPRTRSGRARSPRAPRPVRRARLRAHGAARGRVAACGRSSVPLTPATGSAAQNGSRRSGRSRRRRAAPRAPRRQPVVEREARAVDDPHAGERHAGGREVARTTRGARGASSRRRRPPRRAPSAAARRVKLSLSRSISVSTSGSGSDSTCAAAYAPAGARPTPTGAGGDPVRAQQLPERRPPPRAAGCSATWPSYRPRSTTSAESGGRLVDEERRLPARRRALRVEPRLVAEHAPVDARDAERPRAASRAARARGDVSVGSPKPFSKRSPCQTCAVLRAARRAARCGSGRRCRARERGVA